MLNRIYDWEILLYRNTSLSAIDINNMILIELEIYVSKLGKQLSDESKK